MKTKYLLTAMLLPAAFAACTNDELENVGNGLVTNTETVKMALSATYGSEGAESRMVNNNGTFLWDNTDVLGAALVGTNDAVYTNNRFANTLTEPSTAADFTTQSTTAAGQYTFYYPYSEEVTKAPQNGVIYSLPAVQEYDPTGEKMMKNNFMVAPKITVDGEEPGTLTLPITMRSIYSYGILNLKLADNVRANYSSVTNVKIQKIIIEYSSNVEKDGRIDLDVLPATDITTDRLEAIQAGTYKVNDKVVYPSLKDKTLAEIRAALLEEADNILVGKSDVYSEGSVLNLTTTRSGKTTDRIAKVVISCMTDENPDGVTLSQSSKFSTRVLLPTTSNSGQGKVTVYTDKGMQTIKTTGFNGGVMKANHTVNLANVNRDGDADALYIEGDLTDVEVVEAISEADFISGVKMFAGKNNPQIKVSVNGFNLTPTAIAAIPSTATVIFTSDVTFEGDMTLKKMSFGTNNVTFESGDIVLESVSATAAKYTVKEDADVTVKSLTNNAEADLAEITVDGGKLTIEKYNANGSAATQYACKVEVKNNGVLNVTTPIAASVTLTKGTVNNNSTISNLTVTEGSVTNAGTINNLADNKGTIENSGVIVDGKNSNKINQKLETSKVTLSTNNGTINTVAYSQTTVANNGGDIIFVENARVSADRGVAYEVSSSFKATDFTNLVKAISKLIFTEDFTYAYVENDEVDESTDATLPDTIEELEFKGNLTLAKDWNLQSVKTVSFTGAKADITGAGRTLEGTGLTLKAGKAKTASTAAVATNLYIGVKVTVEALADVVLNGGATVWNDGEVVGSATVGTVPAWSGNAISGTVVSLEALTTALSAAESGDVVKLAGDIEATSEINVKGAVLDGCGNKITATLKKNIVATGGTIQNVTIEGNNNVASDGSAVRGIYNNVDDEVATSDLTLNHVTFSGLGYAYNLYGTEKAKLIVNDCWIEGWSSFTGFASAAFTNCDFVKGAYYSGKNAEFNNSMRCHNDVTFEGCRFSEGFSVKAINTNIVITFKNCTVGGVDIEIESQIMDENENSENVNIENN